MASEAAVTIPSIISAVASGGVGGGVLRVLTGVVKSLLAKS